MSTELPPSNIPLFPTVASYREWRRKAFEEKKSVGFVATMGALHEGHAHLVRRAREENDLVIVSIFVNPLQFGPNEDFERYPSDLDGDLELLRGLGVDLVFAPGLEDMYPGGDPLVTVSAGRLGTVLDGASRPGHFDGVVTVVNKLLSLASGRTQRPLRAYFGQKDAQQLAIVESLVRDLDLPVRIEAVDIQREPEGLARSSRNLYLSDEGRRHALGLSATIAAAREASPSLSGVLAVLDAALSTGGADGLRFDYALALDPVTLLPVEPGHRGPTLVMLAGWVEVLSEGLRWHPSLGQA